MEIMLEKAQEQEQGEGEEPNHSSMLFRCYNLWEII
jgi:hypothetical protein